ncbi:peptide ABC transporter substrate-binding protein [Haliea sp. AH-315-K21]|nr:peptide ABC transporter substrate-binding protein [Haliea sp. AH-315-K21]
MSGVNPETKTIQLALDQEPPQLDYMKATDAVSFFITEHLQEGLIRKNARNQLSPAVALRWEMTGTSVTFWLRENARWSDGEIITAHDFVYAWRRVVNPATASQYVSIMYSIKNAEAINNGQAPLESLGVRALDDFTLQVELESPTGYFLELMAFLLFYPAREDFTEAQDGRFGADVENMLFSGPFILTEWVHGASLRMEKNPMYWNKDSIEINAINIPYITQDGAARFNVYKDGKTALEGGLVGLTAEELEGALNERYRLRSVSDGSVFYLGFNHSDGHITANKNFRKAIQATFDSVELVNKVLGIASYVPGKSLFPIYMNGVENKFRQEYIVPEVELNLERAREYLELARQELGLETFPPISFLIDEGSTGPIVSQYFQSFLKQNLGLDILIDVQTFKLRLQKTDVGDFDLVLAGWSPDYEDPFTFGELFASWNVNNDGFYKSDEYDSLVRLVQSTSNQQIRMDAMGEMQDLIIEDVVILPLYERYITYVQDPRLSGVLFTVTGGSPIFTYARIQEEQ